MNSVHLSFFITSSLRMFFILLNVSPTSNLCKVSSWLPSASVLLKIPFCMNMQVKVNAELIFKTYSISSSLLFLMLSNRILLPKSCDKASKKLKTSVGFEIKVFDRRLILNLIVCRYDLTAVWRSNLYSDEIGDF